VRSTRCWPSTSVVVGFARPTNLASGHTEHVGKAVQEGARHVSEVEVSDVARDGPARSAISVRLSPHSSSALVDRPPDVTGALMCRPRAYSARTRQGSWVQPVCQHGLPGNAHQGVSPPPRGKSRRRVEAMTRNGAIEPCAVLAHEDWLIAPLTLPDQVMSWALSSPAAVHRISTSTGPTVTSMASRLSRPGRRRRARDRSWWHPSCSHRWARLVVSTAWYPPIPGGPGGEGGSRHHAGGIERGLGVPRRTWEQ